MRGILILCGRGWPKGVRGAGRKNAAAKEGVAVRRESERGQGWQPKRAGCRAPAGHRRGGRRVCKAQRGAKTRRPEGVRPAGGSAAGRRGRRKRRRRREAGCGRGDGMRRVTAGKGRRGTDEVPSGGPEGRRPKRGGRRVRAVPEGGDTGGGSVGGRRECGQPEGVRPAGGVEERGGGGAERTAEGSGRRGRDARMRRPEGVWPAGGSAASRRGRRKRRRRRGADCGRGRQARAGRKNAAAKERVAGRRASERGQGRRGPGGGPQQVNRRSPWGRRWRSRS